MQLARIRVGSAPDRAAWAVGHHVSLPESLLTADAFGAFLDGNRQLNLPQDFSTEESLYILLRDHAAYTNQKPLSSRMLFSYQRVPDFLRSIIASCIGRVQRARQHKWASFPGWPIDLSADFLADLAPPEIPTRTTGKTPVLLTHDLDSLEGLQSLVAQFLAAEEKVGAHSYSYTVPCKYPLDHGLLSEIQARGHGIGVHGFDHSNTTAFADQAVRAERLDKAWQTLCSYAPKGYRAPSLLRTKALLQDLGKYYAHDSSIPTSGGLFPVPNNGCASARPFWTEGILEIPLSMPRDGSLRFLGHSPSQILKIWKDCAARIAHSGGTVVLLTHCEQRFSGEQAYFQAYCAFLEHIAKSSEFVFSTPDALAGEYFATREPRGSEHA